ncbi:MAG: Ig-like domain-containing protein [Acidimicrobiales bacterium]|jgi:hypothetical protein
MFGRPRLPVARRALAHFVAAPLALAVVAVAVLSIGGNAFAGPVAPTITSADATTFSTGTAATFTVTATGSPTPTITESGALPSGVTFTDGVLSGAAASSGTFPITITATNGVGTDAIQSFTLTTELLTSGSTVFGSAAAQGSYTAISPFDSGQPIDVVIPPNSVLSANQKIEIFECAAPNGVDPKTTASCDGNSSYDGGTVFVQANGSVDAIADSALHDPYTVFALPDPNLGENLSGAPACGVGASNECVLYVGEGGGSDTGFSLPHFFSQPFQVHADASDSGVIDPGDGQAAAAESVSGSASVVSPATQSVTADGSDPAYVTVTLDSQDGVGVAGKSVTLDATGSATVTTQGAGTDVTDAEGQAMFDVRDSTAETVTVSATDSTDSIPVVQTAQVTFAAPTANLPSSSIVASPTGVPADGTTASTITVTIRDHSVNGSPVGLPGQTVTLTPVSGSSHVADASAGSNVTNAQGEALFTVTDSVDELVTYSASTGGVQLTQSVAVQFGTPAVVSASTSTVVVANRSNAPTGLAGTTATVTLLAADGTTPIPGKSVTLAVQSASGHASVANSPGATNASGVVTFGVTDSTAESVTLTATDTTDGVVLDSKPVVVFVVPPPPTISAADSSVTVSGSPATADGVSVADVTVTVRNTNDQAVSGAAVTLKYSPDDGANVQPFRGIDTTNGSGVVQFEAHDTKAETLSFQASASGITFQQTATATFVAGNTDGIESTVTASPTHVAADGSTSALITVTSTDHFGNPNSGQSISLTQGTGHSVITPVQVVGSVLPGTTDALGVAEFSVTDTTTEVVSYTAVDATAGLTFSAVASVTFGTPPTVLPVTGDSDAVASASSVPADGSSAAVITVELRDGNGLPVTGKSVSLTASGGSSVITAAHVTANSRVGTVVTPSSVGPGPMVSGTPVTVVTNSNGNAVFDVTDTSAESVTYTATDKTDSMTGWTVKVVFAAVVTPTTTTTTTTTTIATTATTAPSGNTGSGVAADESGSTSAAATATTPGLAFTGAPSSLPWLVGLGALLVILGSVSRAVLVARRRGQ